VRVTSSPETVLIPTAIALGNFDGVHCGHQRVIQPVLAWSHATVVTFYPHPQEFFTGQKRTLLTPLEEKVEYLRSLGVEQLVMLPFDEQLAALSPEEFVEKILVQRLKAQKISVGQDFRFGRQRMGTATDLQAIAAKYNIGVNIVSLQTCGGERISSSSIREALSVGDLPIANQLLGRNYSLTGKVVVGQKLARTLGFPTANLELPPEKFLPKHGVYGVRVAIAPKSPSEHPPTSLIGIMNIGTRPTVDGTRITIEVHILNWSGDLYGQTLTASLEKFLRPERKFASLEDLKIQIQADVDLLEGIGNRE
jgi:riboflavin kinase / FMN adenylyltransferase